MKQPTWTIEFIYTAVNDLKKLGFECREPVIKWRKPTTTRFDSINDTVQKVRRNCSSGVCYKSSITICAGKNRVDLKMVILHELVHWVLPWKEHHSPRFWDIAWQLYRINKLPIRYCYNREKAYRKESVNAYKRIKSM